jgi:predicted transcriptional regulator of viral defense system
MKYRLGPLEAQLIFNLERDGKTTFNTAQAQKLLNTTSNSTHRVLQRLTAKGRIQRTKRGEYLLIPARAGYQTKWTEHIFTFLGDLIDNYYIGYWTALNYWGMTDQNPLTVFVATTSRRRTLEYNGTKIKYITLTPKKFFGWVNEKIGDETFRISDPEKTLTDSLDLPQNSGGIREAAKALNSNLDWGKLTEYADRAGNKAVHRRLGYLAEALRVDPPNDAITNLQNRIGVNYAWLDPTAPKKALEINRRWKVNVNLQLETPWRNEAR